MTRSRTRVMFVILPVAAALSAAPAQAFDPANGDWAKDNSQQIRIMSWNILDAIGIGCDTTPAGPSTSGPAYAFDYVGRICHAFDPDVICFTEVEPAVNVTQVMAIVTQWATTYFGAGVFGYIYMGQDDGYNRNFILSKFPFTDLNGDGYSTKSNIGFIIAGSGGLPPGGDAGIRGWTQAEIDLPDAVFAGDLFVGLSHLKAGGDASDLADRLKAAKNISYYINEGLNKSRATGGDPSHYITSPPPNPLPASTPIVLCGDFNEDELTNGRDGPVLWLGEYTTAAGDGTDRDLSTMHTDTSLQLFTTNKRATYGSGSSKLDYIMVQDSIATVVREFVFESSRCPSGGLPPDLTGIQNGMLASSYASDHRPVIMDITPPLVPPTPGDCDSDGDVDLNDYVDCFEPCLLGPGGGAAGSCAAADADEDGDVDLGDFAILQANFGI